jgi:hypothetical protein
MGYETRFEIFANGSEDTIDKTQRRPKDEVVELVLKALSETGREGEWMAEELESYYCGSAKWYEYAKDMTAVSKELPDILICVEGYGEERGDIWRHYFKNGKHKKVKAEITFEPVTDLG